MAKKGVLSDVEKGHRTEQEKELKKAAEAENKDLTVLQKSPPRHLSTVAKTEWKRVYKEVTLLPIKNLDRAVLENYCTWYAIYKELDKAINEQGIVLAGSKPSPLISKLDIATKNLRSLASELGLTVDSRMKIFANKKGNEKPQGTMRDRFKRN